MSHDELPIIAFESAAAWEEWLDQHHTNSRGLWLKIAKKATGIPSVTYQQAIDVALCFGWIDGQRQRFDDQWFLQRFTPRRSQSRWSQINRDRAESLTKRGIMRPAGLQEIERAKADGRWADAYPSPTKMALPDDLRQALEANPPAAAAFAALNATSRYSILSRVHFVKTPVARARRIETIVAMLSGGAGLKAPDDDKH